jgi:hypothetical protein
MFAMVFGKKGGFLPLFAKECGVFFDVCQGFAVLETPRWEEGGDGN